MDANEQPDLETLCLPRKSSSFADRILKWADNNFSDFPWRHGRSPYEILVAELLLKRTTATAAARVYEGFLHRFPSLQAIASSPDEELIEALSSVGLQHQRARAMKRLSIWLLSRHAGNIPSDSESLMEVPGLGNYSANAVLSFGYGVSVAVVDANVERIILRAFGNTLPTKISEAHLDEVAQHLLPADRHQLYNYGLLDLGRLVCRYVDPRCEECPLTSVCDFFERSSVEGTNKVSEASKGHNAGVGKRLRAIRRDRGLSQKRLAEAANVSKLTVIRIESGKSSPRRETLKKLGRVLKVRLEEFSN